MDFLVEHSSNDAILPPDNKKLFQIGKQNDIVVVQRVSQENPFLKLHLPTTYVQCTYTYNLLYKTT